MALDTISAPAAVAAPEVVESIPASGEITLPPCNGTTSTFYGLLNTPGSMVLRGTAAADLRAGKAVFLFDAKGQVVVNSDGSYNGVGARLAYCGAQLDNETGSVTIDWRFCTDESFGGCAGVPPSSVESNTKLNDEQEQAIAVLLFEGDTSSKRSRSLLQLQVWCVTEFGTEEGGVRVEPGNVNMAAQKYFNTHLFSGGNTSENARFSDADATCLPWAVSPDDPSLQVTPPDSPVTAGEVATFEVASNFSGDVRLSASRSLPVTLCPTAQEGVTLIGNILRYTEPGVATVCVDTDFSGDVTLSAYSDGVPIAGGLTYLWNGSPSCQVFADYALGRTEDVADRARAEVLVPNPGFEMRKVSDPASGSDVYPGQVIEYTVTGENTGETALDPVELRDDLSGLVGYVQYNGDATATINGSDAGGFDFDFAGGEASWTGALGVGETVTITYSVTVLDGAVGQLLENRVAGSAVPPNFPPDFPPLTPPDQETEHPVPTPGFTLDKRSDPPEYSTVIPGQTITYFVTAENTGQTVLDPVVVTDDLTDVLEHATLQGSPVATINGAPAAAPEPRGNLLVWEGSLEPGDTLELSYQVSVNVDAVGVTLKNVVTATGTPPGGDPITPPESDTEHPVPTPALTMGKSSLPASGSDVNPGDVIVYTVTASNTGQTVLDPVELRDDLSGLTGSVRYNNDAFATINGSDPAGSFDFDFAGGEASWTGKLEQRETVTITYSVTVQDGAVGKLLENTVSGSAVPPNYPPDFPPVTPPDQETEHPVPTPGFETGKSADPESGSSVNPGDVITYTVTGQNTGGTVLDPVVLTDDLSGLLEHVIYNNDVQATVGGVGPAGKIDMNVEDGIATWTGALQPGETVEVKYSVTVSNDATGELLENRLTGAATPPGGDPLIPPGTETEHPVPAPGFELVKVSDPGSGSAVHPGDVIVYTVTGENTGETVLDPVELRDDLSDLTEFVRYNDDAIATINGSGPAGDFEFDFAAGEASWTGVLAVGETVTIRYSVTVLPGAVGQLLENRVSGTAVPPNFPPDFPPLTPPDQETEHPVPTPGFDLSKSSDPDSGSTVRPGDVVTYSVTGRNVGGTVLDPVIITDDLSDVLNHATLVQGSASATVNGSPSHTPTHRGNLLVWEGALEPGESVVMSYQVRVNDDAAGMTLTNVVTATAMPPGGDPLVPPRVTTQHPVGQGPALAQTGLDATFSWLAPYAVLLVLLGLMLLATRTRGIWRHE